MILDRVDAAPSARQRTSEQRKAAQSGRYNGADRLRSLRILSAATFVTVAVLAGLIAWASLA
jgi:hypothetical protein